MEFRRTIQEENIDAVFFFNKGIFNLVSDANVNRYIERLINGELIESQIKVLDKTIPIFLTFPTGWRYHKKIKDLRLWNLDIIYSKFVIE
jgi:hypothetical protein